MDILFLVFILFLLLTRVYYKWIEPKETERTIKQLSGMLEQERKLIEKWKYNKEAMKIFIKTINGQEHIIETKTFEFRSNSSENWLKTDKGIIHYVSVIKLVE